MVLPVCAPPIPDGAVRVCDGAITAVGPASAHPPQPGDDVLSFPDGILLPGLVNAHCHLELGDLAGRVPFRGTFSGWLVSLMAFGRPNAAAVAQSVRAGVRALLAGGATCVGDITTTGFALDPLRRSGLRAVSFRELLGLTPDRASEALATAREWLQQPAPGAPDPRGGRVRMGLSPHAPYSTAATVYREAAQMARAANAPFSTHLSESLEEFEFVVHGTGGLLEVLRSRGIPAEVWEAPGQSPVSYLDALGALAVPGAAAHVNYLMPGDLERLASGRLTPVYCPGSHAFFGHPPHPAGALLRAGVPVALGTDSLASNTGLSLLAEARLAWERTPGTRAEDWVRAATRHGARALCLDGVCGELAPGRRADLVVVHPGRYASDPYAAVLSPGTTVRLVLVDGEPVWPEPADGAAG